MSEEYPLYPELTEQGKEEAQKIMDSFKPKLAKLLDEVMCDLYTDVSYYVDGKGAVTVAFEDGREAIIMPARK